MASPSPTNPQGPATKTSALVRVWRTLGPGVITGAADDDPSGIATYSIAGAQLGTGLLWTALITWPLMGAVQMMCARIGMVTGSGLARALRKKMPKPIALVIISALLVANTINVGSDLAGMADAAQLLTGWNARYFVLLFGVGITAVTIKWPYQKIARILKWLVLSLGAYVPTAFITKPDWPTVFRDALVPSWPHDRATWSTIVAILGTTISPYLFFWQAAEEVEEEKAMGRRTQAQRAGATASEIIHRRIDVGLGTFVSNCVMFFIILSCATTLHRHGVTEIASAKEAAEALRPLAGNFAAVLYTVGLLGVGCLAIPTLAGSAAYAFAEVFGWRQGLDHSYRSASRFYLVLIAAVGCGMAMNWAKIPPLKALYWTAIINGIIAPFILVGIYLVATDRKLMGGQTSSRLSRVVVIITTLAMAGAGGALFFV